MTVMRAGAVGAGARRSASFGWLAAVAVVVTVLSLAAYHWAVTQSTQEVSETTYEFAEIFSVPYMENQQGLAYANGIHYVGFDVGDGNGNGRIVAYDEGGAEIKRSPDLPLGHTAELSHRAADGNLYVAIAAGGAGLEVGVVDMRRPVPELLRTYDFSDLGTSGMVAIDNARDQMVIKAGPRSGPHTFTTTDMDGNVLAQFSDASQGVGQGLEVVGDDVLLYTSAPDELSNQITVYSRSGQILSRIPVPIANEGQGLSVDHRTGEVHVGFRNHAVLTMSPVYEPTSSGSDLLDNGGATRGTAGTGHDDGVELPGWEVTGGMTALRYGADPGYPGAGSPGPANRGRAFFSGGPEKTSTMRQTVDHSRHATRIDRGGATYHLHGWLGGHSDQHDRVEVQAIFLDSGGEPLGSAALGPVTPEDRGEVTGLLHRTDSGKVPVGTRSVEVVVTATRAEGTNNDGYVDNVGLTIQ